MHPLLRHVLPNSQVLMTERISRDPSPQLTSLLLTDKCAKWTTSISKYLILNTTQHHVYQSREGEEGDLGSDAGISSHKGYRFTASISFTLGLCDRIYNNFWSKVERLVGEKDLTRFLPTLGAPSVTSCPSQQSGPHDGKNLARSFSSANLSTLNR